ncbi:hypothetical protein FRC10_011636 [Ceratobasidium sp. 414]|nr:hypothetical protein FRC10_011636 [Ceratobasidium sp. 414]
MMFTTVPRLLVAAAWLTFASAQTFLSTVPVIGTLTDPGTTPAATPGVTPTATSVPGTTTTTTPLATSAPAVTTTTPRVVGQPGSTVADPGPTTYRYTTTDANGATIVLTDTFTPSYGVTTIQTTAPAGTIIPYDQYTSMYGSGSNGGSISSGATRQFAALGTGATVVIPRYLDTTYDRIPALFSSLQRIFMDNKSTIPGEATANQFTARRHVTAPFVFPLVATGDKASHPTLTTTVSLTIPLLHTRHILFASPLFSMHFSHTVVALYAIALAGFAAAQGGLTVATPASIVQCQPAQLSWSGGTGPYFPSIIPGSQPNAAALKSFPSQPGTSLVWNPVDLAQGTSITIQVRDSTGAVQYSSAVTIQNSSDASCLNGGASTGAAGASTAPATSNPAATTPAASTAAPSNTTPRASRQARLGLIHSASSAAGSSTRSVASASASAKPNSASTVTKGAFGVAALAGLVGAALL